MEAINHTHACVKEPGEGKKRSFARQATVYGRWMHPLLSWSQHHKKEADLLEKGYPVICDTESEVVVTAPVLDRFLKKQSDPERALVGRKIAVHVGKSQVLNGTIESFSWDVQDKLAEKETSTSSSQYRWWTWHPEFHNMGVAISVVFFVGTIIFQIPAIIWYPMDNSGKASIASQIVWIQGLQVRACVQWSSKTLCSVNPPGSTALHACSYYRNRLSHVLASSGVAMRPWQRRLVPG